LYAGSAVFEQKLVTGNISSQEALHLYSGKGADILLMPGDRATPGAQPGSVIIHSDVSLENFQITADTFNATQSLSLGNSTLGVQTSTFRTSGGDITFAPATGGRILLKQQTCAPSSSPASLPACLPAAGVLDPIWLTRHTRVCLGWTVARRC
jgi:hypothetical protein